MMTARMDTAGTTSTEAFPSPSDSVGAVEREITVFLRRVESAMSLRSARERLVRSGYLLLSALEHSGPLGVAVLAHATGVDISTTSRQIVPLEKQGLVRRYMIPSDRRTRLIEITPLGREQLEATREERHRLFLELLADWPEQDRETFAALLARFNTAIAARHSPRR